MKHLVNTFLSVGRGLGFPSDKKKLFILPEAVCRPTGTAAVGLPHQSVPEPEHRRAPVVSRDILFGIITPAVQGLTTAETWEPGTGGARRRGLLVSAASLLTETPPHPFIHPELIAGPSQVGATVR